MAVAVVSTPFPIPLGLRFQAPGEGEVACAQALLEELVGQLGRRFVDVLVADALYFGKPVIDAIEALGLDWVCSVKDNQPELVAELARRTSDVMPAETVTPDVVTHLWYVPDVHWAAGDRSVRCVKEVRRAAQTRVHVQREGGHCTRHKRWRGTRARTSTPVVCSSWPVPLGGSRRWGARGGASTRKSSRR